MNQRIENLIQKTYQALVLRIPLPSERWEWHEMRIVATAKSFLVLSFQPSKMLLLGHPSLENHSEAENHGKTKATCSMNAFSKLLLLTGKVMGFRTSPLVCSSVYPQFAWCAWDTVSMTSYTANCFVSESDCSASEVETLDCSSVLLSRDLFGTRPYLTAKIKPFHLITSSHYYNTLYNLKNSCNRKEYSN